MAIRVIVEDEQRREIASMDDPNNVLHRLLPRPEDTAWECLNRIDWYGETLFNRYQVPLVRKELSRLMAALDTAPEVQFVRQIAALAERCGEEPHLYLRFSGD